MTRFTEEQFTGFKRKHYRVASGPCWDACAAYRKLREDVGGQHFEFAKSVGGVGLYEGNAENVGNASAISAVIFPGEPPAGWKRRRWSSFRNLKAGQTAGWPDQRSSVGKAALAVIKALPLLPSSNRVCEAIGFPHSLSYRKEGSSGSQSLGLFETANVGWLETVFYVSLPDYVAIRAKREAEDYEIETPPWSPLEGMEPILKEEADLEYAKAAAARATGDA